MTWELLQIYLSFGSIARGRLQKCKCIPAPTCTGNVEKLFGTDLSVGFLGGGLFFPQQQYAVCLNIRCSGCSLSFSLLISLADVMNDRTVDEVKITAYFWIWLVVCAYTYLFVLSLCYYFLSACLKLPCLVVFLPKENTYTQQVAIVITLTVKQVTSDGREVTLSRQWGILYWYLVFCMCQTFWTRLQIKFGGAVWLPREGTIQCYCGSSCNPAACRRCQAACLLLLLVENNHVLCMHRGILLLVFFLASASK